MAHRSDKSLSEDSFASSRTRFCQTRLTLCIIRLETLAPAPRSPRPIGAIVAADTSKAFTRFDHFQDPCTLRSFIAVDNYSGDSIGKPTPEEISQSVIARKLRFRQTTSRHIPMKRARNRAQIKRKILIVAGDIWSSCTAFTTP